MRRFSLVIATIAGLYAPALFGQPTPTPTRTPTAHDGPTLDVTFSGVVLFLKTTPGYRVIVPARQAQKHLPYMIFPMNGTTSNWDAVEFDCAGWFKRVPLTADKLTIEPATSIARAPFKAGDIEGWLPHLSALTESNSVNADDYNQATPVVGKVAAQIDITRGTLKPLTLEGDQYVPVQWEFRSKDGTQTSDVTFCGAAGIRWLLPIKKDIGSISIVSSLKKHPKVTVPLVNGQTTVVIIGNSMVEDIECPKGGRGSKDPDFEIHYKMLKTEPATAWIPYKVAPKVTCVAPPEGLTGNKSARGSDCIGSQWP